jgi:hypothetical protein
VCLELGFRPARRDYAAPSKAHGTPRQAADAALAALVASMRIVLQSAVRNIVRFAERFFGTILPHSTAHRLAADRAA